MKKYLVAFVIALLPMTAVASGAGPKLDHVEIDLHNQASLQRGMQTFVNNCLGCHSAQYQRYGRAAEDLGMPIKLVEQNLLLGDQKVGQQMTNTMPKQDANKWFGNAPPDLTLEARLRGPDWIYTYLHSFYKDTERPWGVNNIIFPSVGMPNALEYLQGEQTLHCTLDELHHETGKIDPLTGKEMGGCLTISKKGQQSAEEFDRTVTDLVNFMAYIGEPSKLESHRIGTKVLIFLFLFFFVAYALKKEYWKDVH
ncbi:cytochrome c1 [Neptunomonas antarctica]|uniref:Ubiquinol-cytochrome c reductase cytochrome c1 subunit n=1 Tax=Neptunomonas antarctica TaxID=619304 RepID=A0A1N7PF89_9GAMM|nr:cytochrome c1 [Neptunomonas antarctica]SIT09251.1 ubiquinol-cytochrome c reductase cytochrome c1 subunit [Neptunomonas antarctica]